MEATIRYATMQDAPLIAELSRTTFVEAFGAQNSKADMDKFLNEIFTMENLIAEVANTCHTFFLVVVDGDVAGYVKLRENEHEDGLLEIARIYVLESFIGKGAGKTLLNECLQIAKQKNKRTIWLGVWEKNERAIYFYQSFGFQKYGEHPFVLGNDVQTDWLMKKTL